jgi:hypothetical protein
VAVVLGDVDDGLQHEDREGNSRDPGHEADYIEDREDQIDDGGTVVVSCEINNCGSDTEDDLQDASNPDGSVITLELYGGPRREELTVW